MSRNEKNTDIGLFSKSSLLAAVISDDSSIIKPEYKFEYLSVSDAMSVGKKLFFRINGENHYEQIPMNRRMRRAYARKSSSNKSQKNSLQIQILCIEKVAKSEINPSDYYQEKISAKDAIPLVLNQLLENAPNGTVLYVRDISRLSRHIYDVLSIVRILIQKKMIVYSCCDGQNVYDFQKLDDVQEFIAISYSACYENSLRAKFTEMGKTFSKFSSKKEISFDSLSEKSQVTAEICKKLEL